MGDKTVFQQQARMQAAQLEQNQMLMQQNAKQIELLEKAQNEADEAKRVSNELFEAGRRVKKLVKIAEAHKDYAYILCQAEQRRWKTAGLTGSALPDITSKEKLDKVETQIEELLNGIEEPDDTDEVLRAIDQALSVTTPIGGHDVDALELAKEQWAVSAVEQRKREWAADFSSRILGAGSIFMYVAVAAFLVWILPFLLPFWIGFILFAVAFNKVKAGMDITSYGNQVDAELQAFKANCQSYRAWAGGSTGVNFFKDYFSESSAALKLVMEGYTV